MSMEDMGVTDQAFIDHVELRLSRHPISGVNVRVLSLTAPGV